MRRTGWPLLGLALAAALAVAAAPAATAPGSKPKADTFGKGPAYRALATLPVMHAGRVKPLDTLAREEIKQIHGRETIKLLDDDGEVVATWEPVAALVDWPVRPADWDDRAFIKVEYLPLKRALLAGAAKATLASFSEKDGVPAADRDRIARVAGQDEVAEADLRPILTSATLPLDARKAIGRLAGRLGEGRKFLSPAEIEDSTVRVDGRAVPFGEWVGGLFERERAARAEGKEGPVLNDLEEKGKEAGMAFARYRSIRDRDARRLVPLLVAPRPFNRAYIVETGLAYRRSEQAPRGSGSRLDADLAETLDDYLEKNVERRQLLPGTDESFDASFAGWLDEGSAWVPLSAFLGSSPDELAKAGFPRAESDAFRRAFRALDDAERASPGNIDRAPVDALLAASRALGLAIKPRGYPSLASMETEVKFNNVAPFLYAPFLYGGATALLVLSLAVGSAGTGVLASLRRAFYAVGMLLFVGGIGLEVWGFAFRVLITGWAPVTNMYETVIWVGLVTAVLGLVFEAITRRTFPAAAGAGVATATTYLAATVPLLDPSIHALVPVLQSNYWLGIHVLTIVSSYAAFALAMGLGLIATWYYLTATYRRSASFAELLAPLLPGAPLLASGVLLREASYGVIPLGPTFVSYGFWPSVILSAVGLVLSLASLVAAFGEAVNRSAFAPKRARLTPTPLSSKPSPSPRVLVAAGDVMPPISGGSGLDDQADADARTLAMQATAGKIKPLAQFIYRAMQFGVLLVAAGTILGGVWADYSWGRFWGWDPKEVWALITLLVYIVPLHGRFAGWVNTFGLVIASVVCFLSVLMAWYGVNFVLGVGLHAYGFTKGGSQGTVALATLIVLAIPAGAGWRRHLSQIKVGVA